MKANDEIIEEVSTLYVLNQRFAVYGMNMNDKFGMNAKEKKVYISELPFIVDFSEPENPREYFTGLPIRYDNGLFIHSYDPKLQQQEQLRNSSFWLGSHFNGAEFIGPSPYYFTPVGNEFINETLASLENKNSKKIINEHITNFTLFAIKAQDEQKYAFHHKEYMENLASNISSIINGEKFCYLNFKYKLFYGRPNESSCQKYNYSKLPIVINITKLKQPKEAFTNYSMCYKDGFSITEKAENLRNLFFKIEKLLKLKKNNIFIPVNITEIAEMLFNEGLRNYNIDEIINQHKEFFSSIVDSENKNNIIVKGYQYFYKNYNKKNP